MPLGINAPSVFGMAFAVLGPAYVATGDAELTWKMGMAVTVILGVIKTRPGVRGQRGSPGRAARRAPGIDRRSGDRPDRRSADAEGAGEPDRRIHRLRRHPGDAAGPGAAARRAPGSFRFGPGRHRDLLGARGGRREGPLRRRELPARPGPSTSPSRGQAWLFSAACRWRGDTCRSRCRSRSRRSWAGRTTPRAPPLPETSTTPARFSRPRPWRRSPPASAAVSSRAPRTSAIPAYKKMGAGAGYAVATGLFVGLGGVLGYLPFLIDWIPAAAVAPILDLHRPGGPGAGLPRHAGAARRGGLARGPSLARLPHLARDRRGASRATPRSPANWRNPSER